MATVSGSLNANAFFRSSTTSSLQIVHKFISGVDDGADATRVRPTNWDAEHQIVGWTSGSSMPSNPRQYDRCWRTDLGLEFFYDGTRWVSTNLYLAYPSVPTALTSASASFNAGSINLDIGGGTDQYIVAVSTKFFVASGGTALGASHNWVCTVTKSDVNNASTTVATITVNSGSSAVWRSDAQTINALYTPGTYYRLSFSWIKTGTPGNITPVHVVSYRIVAT